MCKMTMSWTNSAVMSVVNREGETLSLAYSAKEFDFCTFPKDQPDFIANHVYSSEAELYLHALAAHLGFTIKKIGE